MPRKKKSSKWRPTQKILVKVIGVCINESHLLAMEVYNDNGKVKGIRPLGGLIEFGEMREVALAREFKEELGTDIVTAGAWRTFENTYEHHGQIGHEYIFAIAVSLTDKSLYDNETMVFSEDSASENIARWYPIDQLKSGSIELYPTGLVEKL